MSALTRDGNGTVRRAPAGADLARAERKARLEALIASPEWQEGVAPALRAQWRRTADSLAGNAQLTDREMREGQARCAVLAALLRRPLQFLTECEVTKGDE